MTRGVLKFVASRGRIGHELHKIGLSPASIVAEILLPKVEVLEGWKSRDLVQGTQGLVQRAVDGSKRHFLVVCKLLRGTRVLWFGGLAVATPRGIEHDKSMLLLFEERLEVFLSQVGYL